jgi:adenylosuccinate lyase
LLERYTLPEMRKLWSPECRFQKWLDLEVLACEAWADLGRVPDEAVQEIRSKARFDVERIAEIEAVTRHDVIAFVSCVAENVGDAGKYLHLGLTSYDIVDTALSLLMRDALDLILEALDDLRELLADQAREYQNLPMVGRTHGVHAEPISLGLKFALWYAELDRARGRLEQARQEIGVGRLSGAVGTYAHLDPYVENYVCRRTGLTPAKVSTQVLQRDRHAGYLSALAVAAGSLEKFATEIRHLQRTEVLEMEEGFAAGQKGSSAMPHKRNPVNCERIAGLARVLRGNSTAALENISLWHERDITHSSVERIIIPDSTTLLHYMIVQFTEVLRGLQIYPQQMERNLNRTHGLIFSQRLLLALVAKGLSREEAYTLVQRQAHRNWPEGDFMAALKADPAIGQYLQADEIDGLCDARHYLDRTDYIFWRAGLGPAPVNYWESIAGLLTGQHQVSDVVKGELLYEGKAKQMYRTSDPDLVWVTYKDAATAFDGLKKDVIAGKGTLNNRISAHFFSLLEAAGIPTHFVKLLSPHEMLVKRAEIVPLEVIVRNIAAGSLAKRLGIEEGLVLLRPAVEFSYKNDDLHDPLVTEDQIVALGWADASRLQALRSLALAINEILRSYLVSKNLVLVDFKLEFGLHNGSSPGSPDAEELLLADEISPDTCRFWDRETNEKLDKDRFRRDLGGLIPAYEEVWKRISN